MEIKPKIFSNLDFAVNDILYSVVLSNDVVPSLTNDPKLIYEPLSLPKFIGEPFVLNVTLLNFNNELEESRLNC